MTSFSIDLRRIDQSRCKKITRRDGTAASFCELVIIETPESEFGDFIVKQSISKEDREAGVKMPILGNGRNPKPAAEQEGEVAPW